MLCNFVGSLECPGGKICAEERKFEDWQVVVHPIKESNDGKNTSLDNL